MISGFLRLFRSGHRVFLMFSKLLPHQTNLILTQRFGTKSPTDSTGFRHHHLAPSVGNGTKSRLVISIIFYLAEAKAEYCGAYMDELAQMRKPIKAKWNAACEVCKADP